MRSHLAVLALALWSVALPALAESPESKANRDEARVHFKQGVVLVREGAYRAALVELKRAYELSPDYRVLFNIGQTELALGEYAAAMDAFESYLSQGGERVEPERRADVEANLSELRRRIASVRIEASADGVEIAIDGSHAGTTPLTAPLKVSVGRHEITGTTPDGRSARETVELAGGDERVVHLTLSSAALDPGLRSAAAPAPVRPPVRHGKRNAGIVLSSLGGALAVGAVVTGIHASGACDDHERALDARPGDAGDIAATRSDLKRYALMTDVLGGAGGVLLATGVVLLLLPERRDDERPVAVDVGPRGLSVRGRF